MAGLQSICYIKEKKCQSVFVHFFVDYDHAYAYCMGENLPTNLIQTATFDARGHLLFL